MIYKIKRTLAIILCLSSAAFFCACSGDGEISPSESSGTQIESPDSSEDGDGDSASDNDSGETSSSEENGDSGKKDGTIIVLPPEKF